MPHKPAKMQMGARPSIDVVSTEMESQRQHQSVAINALDSKAGVVLGFSGTALALWAAAPSVAGDPFWPVIEFLFLVGAVVLATLALAPADFRFDPKPRVLFDYMHKSPDAPGSAGAKEQILADKVEAYEKNELVLKQKADYVFGAIIFLGFGLFMVSARTLGRKIVKIDRKETHEVLPSAPKVEAAVAVPPAQPNSAAANVIRHAEPNPAAVNVIRKSLPDGKLEK